MAFFSYILEAVAFLYAEFQSCVSDALAVLPLLLSRLLGSSPMKNIDKLSLIGSFALSGEIKLFEKFYLPLELYVSKLRMSMVVIRTKPDLISQKITVKM